MILFDTNVIIDARNSSEPHHAWAMAQIETAVGGEGGAVNAVTLSELCAGSPQPGDIAPEITKLDLQILDLPSAVSEVCGRAYRQYVLARRTSGGGSAPKIPLPDFFIGAHAEVMGWKLATRDHERIAKYFPKVQLLTPQK